MSINGIYLSGWEYNRIASPVPWDPVVSGLPAYVLWNGAIPFWMFESTYCTKESLEGDFAAASTLDWSTGRIFATLERKGFLKTVDWKQEVAKDESLRKDLQDARDRLSAYANRRTISRLVEEGDNETLEGIKAHLLRPFLSKLKCVQNVLPGSVDYWFPAEQQSRMSESPSERAVAEGIRALVEATNAGLVHARAHFGLCNPPGTGRTPEEVQRQRHVELTVERPMIPNLLAGILPQAEYHQPLQRWKEAYAPINEQLQSEFDQQIGELERLRDVAKSHLWPKLHGEWLPELKENPQSLPQFKRLVSEALQESRYSPWLRPATSIWVGVVTTTTYYGAKATLDAMGVDPSMSDAGAKVTAGATYQYFRDRQSQRDKEVEQLALFFRKAHREPNG